MRERQRSTAAEAGGRPVRRGLRLATAAAACCAGPIGVAQPVGQGGLFTDASPLTMALEVDFRDICRDPKVFKCGDTPAKLSYRNPSGTWHDFDVMLTTRGRGSARTAGCGFPSLLIRFREDQTVGTVFAEQSVWPYTTHCFHYSQTYHEYLLSEYLAYQLYNMLTENSLRVRLAEVAYRTPGGRREFTRYGFFTEHFEAAAERLNAEPWQPAERVDPFLADATEMAQLALFQFMIGNLDWSITYQHNIVVMRRADQGFIAMPYDFDFSGLVDAEYAVPPKQYRIRSVRTRRYHGLCRPDVDWDGLFARFLAHRDEAYDLARTLPGVGKPRRGRILSYLDSFFDILESPRDRERRIISACRKPG